MATYSFLDQLTGNIDFSGMYDTLANEVSSKIAAGKQTGINAALTATGKNKEVLDQAAAQANSQGLMGPIATAIQGRTQSRLSSDTAGKLAGNEMKYNSAQSNLENTVGVNKNKMEQLQNQSVQDMAGNIFSGIGSIMGAYAAGSATKKHNPNYSIDTPIDADIKPVVSPEPVELGYNNDSYLYNDNSTNSSYEDHGARYGAQQYDSTIPKGGF